MGNTELVELFDATHRYYAETNDKEKAIELAIEKLMGYEDEGLYEWLHMNVNLDELA